MSTSSDIGLIKRLSVFASAASLFSIAVGVSGLCGWAFHITVLGTWGAARVRMVANTAACFVLIGLSLWLQRKKDEPSFPRARKLAARTSAAIAALTAALSLTEHLFGWDFHIDQLLAPVPPLERIAGVRPGLMASCTAADLLFLSLALFLLDWKTRSNDWPAQFLAIGAAMGAIFGHLALLLQPGTSGLTMALPTAMTLFVLACGLVCSRTTWAIGGLLTSPSAGARLLRRVTPAAVVGLGILGWFIRKPLLTEAHYTWVEASLLAILCGALLAGFTTWIAFIVDRSEVLSAELERRVTERTAALRESEARLAGIIHSAMDAILSVDEEQRIVMFNAAAEKMFGCSEQDPMGQSIERLIPQRFRVAHQAHIRNFSETGVTNRAMRATDILSALRCSGEEFPIEASISQIETGSKKLFTVIVRDITERKQAEDALRKSEERFRALVTASSDVVYRMSPDWSEMRQLGGKNFLADTEAPNRNWLQEYIHPDDQARVTAAINEAIRTKSTFELEHHVLRVDGSLGWTLSRAIPLQDENGEIVEWFGAASDVTERKRAEAALSEQAEELSRKAEELSRSNADLEQFAYVASHDLQEPLRMVTAYTQLLGERYRGKMDANADKFIGYASEGAQRMQVLIQDLLAFSRVGRSEVASASVDCNAMMQDVLQTLSSGIEESGAVVTWKTLPTVWADRTQIAQVFQNLVGNAIKFRGQDRPVISVWAEREDMHWLFSVSDNGIGIAPENAEQIFVVFQRLHARAEYPGNGIGLAICKKIVERCGGRIWVESQPGSGSTFKFTMPLHGSNKYGSDEREGLHDEIGTAVAVGG